VGGISAFSPLKLGRLVEAEAPRDQDDRRVFVEVRPLINLAKGTLISQGAVGGPRLLRNRPNEEVIRGYDIRSCALNPGWETEPDDWDRFVQLDKRGDLPVAR